MVWKVFKNISMRRATLPHMAKARRLHYEVCRLGKCQGEEGRERGFGVEGLQVYQHAQSCLATHG